MDNLIEEINGRSILKELNENSGVGVGNTNISHKNISTKLAEEQLQNNLKSNNNENQLQHKVAENKIQKEEGNVVKISEPEKFPNVLPSITIDELTDRITKLDILDKGNNQFEKGGTNVNSIKSYPNSGFSSDDEAFVECESYPLSGNKSEFRSLDNSAINSEIIANNSVKWDNFVSSLNSLTYENLENSHINLDLSPRSAENSTHSSNKTIEMNSQDKLDLTVDSYETNFKINNDDENIYKVNDIQKNQSLLSTESENPSNISLSNIEITDSKLVSDINSMVVGADSSEQNVNIGNPVFLLEETGNEKLLENMTSIKTIRKLENNDSISKHSSLSQEKIISDDFVKIKSQTNYLDDEMDNINSLQKNNMEMYPNSQAEKNSDNYNANDLKNDLDIKMKEICTENYSQICSGDINVNQGNNSFSAMDAVLPIRSAVHNKVADKSNILSETCPVSLGNLTTNENKNLPMNTTKNDSTNTNSMNEACDLSLSDNITLNLSENLDVIKTSNDNDHSVNLNNDIVNQRRSLPISEVLKSVDNSNILSGISSESLKNTTFSERKSLPVNTTFKSDTVNLSDLNSTPTSDNPSASLGNDIENQSNLPISTAIVDEGLDNSNVAIESCPIYLENAIASERKSLPINNTATCVKSETSPMNKTCDLSLSYDITSNQSDNINLINKTRTVNDNFISFINDTVNHRKSFPITTTVDGKIFDNPDVSVETCSASLGTTCTSQRKSLPMSTTFTNEEIDINSMNNKFDLPLSDFTMNLFEKSENLDPINKIDFADSLNNDTLKHRRSVPMNTTVECGNGDNLMKSLHINITFEGDKMDMTDKVCQLNENPISPKTHDEQLDRTFAASTEALNSTVFLSKAGPGPSISPTSEKINPFTDSQKSFEGHEKEFGMHMGNFDTNDEEFQKPGMILNPADIDFLFTKGNVNNVPVDRTSLLLKFDPYLSKPVLANQSPLTNQLKRTTHEGFESPLIESVTSSKLSPHVEEEEYLNGITCAVNDFTNSSNEKSFSLDSKFGAIKKIKSEDNDKMSIDVVRDTLTTKTESNVLDAFDNNINSADRNYDLKMEDLEKKVQNEVLKKSEESGKKIKELEQKLKEVEQREENLLRRITEKDKTTAKMGSVIEAYEKAIAEMIAEKEEITHNYDKQLNEIKTDRDLNYQHLASLESTFADLHMKYERSKQITLTLRNNEESSISQRKQLLDNLRLQEQRYEKMKSHAMQQLDIANDKLNDLGKNHTSEVTKLKALLKKEEISKESIKEQLQQKDRENQELVKICDELISGQGS